MIGCVVPRATSSTASRLLKVPMCSEKFFELLSQLFERKIVHANEKIVLFMKVILGHGACASSTTAALNILDQSQDQANLL